MVKITDIDKKIMYLLNLDARLPVTKIARAVNLSKDAVQYRINKLVKNKVISKFYLDIDHEKLGFHLYTIFLKTRSVSLEQEKKIITGLCKIKEVIFVSTCSGNWDFWIETYAESLETFNTTLASVATAMGPELIDYKTMISIKDYKRYKPLPESYFLGTRLEKTHMYVPKPGKATIDETDYKILKTLELNSRMGVVELAKKCSITIDIVRYRLKKLVSSGVIIGFDIDVARGITEYYLQLLIIRLQNYNTKNERRFSGYLATHPSVRFASKAAGSQEVMLELLTKSMDELNSFVKEIRHTFTDIITTYEIIAVDREYKDCRVPEIFFNKK